LRIILSVEHPAWAHQFRYVIRELEKKGHTIKVVAINKDRDLELLDAFGIPYEVICNSSGKNIVEKGFIFLWTTFKIFLISFKFKPDIFIGRASPMMAINSFLFRKPHIVFEDTEHSEFCLIFCKLFSQVIITSNSFTKDLGKKQLRIDAFKELFYLHPNWFTPDPKIVDELGISPHHKYVILRFVAWDAHHDFGQSGIKDKISFVKELEKSAVVLITSEKKLPKELEPNKISVNPEKLHHLLYYATLYVGEGSTTASECAVLGTHAIYVNTLKLGYIDEEETKYHLVYSYCKPENSDDEILIKVKELLKDPDLWIKGKQKRKLLLKDKIDVTAFLIWFIEKYPLSGKMN
jgi:predicted glycosyltransferase